MSVEDIRSTLVPVEVLTSPWDDQRYILRAPTPLEVEVIPEEETHYRENWNRYVNVHPDQGPRGTCVGFSNVLDSQINQEWRTGEVHDLSEEDLYWKARKYDGIPDFYGEGSNNLGAMKARQKEGVCTEATRPYNSNDIVGNREDYKEESRYHGIDNYYQIPLMLSSWKASIAGIISDPQWDGPKPIVAAYKVTNTMLNYARDNDGLMPLDPGMDLAGAHSSVFGAYKNIDDILHLGNWNSWGPDYGDEGWCWFPASYLQNGIIMEGWISHYGEKIGNGEVPSSCLVAEVYTGVYNGLNKLRGGSTRLKAVIV